MLRDTGQYEKITREGKIPFLFYTFTPRPLVGNDFYVIDGELSSLLINAHRELGILEALSEGVVTGLKLLKID